ncbi:MULTISPECIES: hypothetical protein [Myxococcus]|nr:MULTISPECIES: hypothetical protein [Myxococcus]WAM30095.1 hypothetical protein OZ403_18975 [Myxococcus sp. NMCA1]
MNEPILCIALGDAFDGVPNPKFDRCALDASKLRQTVRQRG